MRIVVTPVLLIALWAVVGTAPARADVETTGTTVRTTTTALLEGRVHPEGKATDFYFEYGAAGPCATAPCAQTAPVSAGAGEDVVPVAQRVTGLMPGTTYHYRAVANNGEPSGPIFGEDMTISTFTDSTLLIHGPLPGPPDSDRAWEEVNAADTGGHPVTELKAVSSDGNRVLYNVKGGTPESTFGGVFSPLLAERSPAGWTSHNITGTQHEESGIFKNWEKIAADPSLTTFVGRNERSVGNTLWRLAAGRESSLLDSAPAFSFFAMSENGSRVVARPAGPNENLYDATSGTPDLIDRLSNGSIPACGTTVAEDPLPDFASQGYSLPEAPMAEAHWVSRDGNLVVFPSQGNNCSGPSELYVRNIAAGTTQRISPPPIEGAECSAAFIRATGGAVYFFSLSKLTAADPSSPGACGFFSALVHGDIYRYEIASGALTCLTCLSSEPSEVQFGDPGEENGGMASFGVSENGERIYFRASRPLIAGAAPTGLYRLNTVSDQLRYIGPAEAESNAIGDRPTSFRAMTPNGAVVAFRSDEPGLNAIGGLQNGLTQQYYRYDDMDRSLTCVSCPPDGSEPTVGADVSVLQSSGFVTAGANNMMGPNLSPLSADGAVFAFSTPLPLVPEDQNTPKSSREPPGVGTDAYEWRSGRIMLVSEGTSRNVGEVVGVPTIAGVSPSGNDVYFTDAARLTPDAIDSSIRLYDARIGGGFSFATGSERPPCQLEVCQGTPDPPPTQPSSGSATFVGLASPAPHANPMPHINVVPHKTAKKRHKKRHHGKPGRHVKTKKRSNGRAKNKTRPAATFGSANRRALQ